MDTPMVMHPLVRAWRCRSHAHCCGGWRIDVAPAALRGMAERCNDAGDVISAMHLLRQHDGDLRLDGMSELPRNASDDCIFLQADRLCGYRVKHDWPSLPLACRRFPMLGMLTPRRRLFGLSFACPTALELLAGTTDDRLVTEPPELTQPTDSLCDFTADGADPDHHAAATAFWDEHWRWVEVWRDARGTPEQRLRRLVDEAAPGAELPDATVPAESFAAWAPACMDPLVAQGASRAVLDALVADAPPCRPLPPIAPPDDDDALIARYLEHRLLVPEYLVTAASLGRLLGVQCALLARFRLERARGTDALDAVRRLDRLLLHNDWPSGLFPVEVPEHVAWQSLALAALAQRVPATALG